MGLLRRGYKADFIAVKGNPLDDISLLVGGDNVHLVVKDGVVAKNVVGGC